MTDPHIYPDEKSRLKAAKDRLDEEFMTTPLTETNKRIFEMAAHNEFGDAGFTINVEWAEIIRNHQPTGVFQPSIELTGRNRREQETDHDRHQWGVVKGLDDGQPGYIRADGSLREDPVKRDIL